MTALQQINPWSASAWRLLRWLFVLAVAGTLVYFGVYTWHWPMLVNAPVMHYVNFLLQHGLQPYSQITDMNMPGAYLLERTGMTVFGGSDLGWRCYDFFLALCLVWSMVVIAKPHDWMGGVFAGGLFALRHISEGPWFSGEREQEMTVLLVASCALLFTAVRKQRAEIVLGFGFLAGMAASVKPTLAPFGVLALGLMFLRLRKQRIDARPYVAWGVGGLAVAAAISVLFLAAHHAFAAFAFVLHVVVPVYASLNDPGRRDLLKNAVPPEWLLLIPLGALGLLLHRAWNWEKGVVLLGAACGLFSYVLQGKGFWYQRYIFLAFALLLVSMEIFARNGYARHKVIGALALTYALLYVLPHAVRDLHRLPGPSALTEAMERDFEALGGQKLQGKIQCFDMTFGCLNSLYHLGLVENTGFTGDMLLFPEKQNAATDHYRHMFWDVQARQPAEVLVISNQEFGASNSFTRFARWPKFSDYLSKNYRLVVQRTFPHEDRYKNQSPWTPLTAPSYKIYVRDKTAVPALSGSFSESGGSQAGERRP